MKTTTLRILDQVNCKFEGLDPHVRRRIVDRLKYWVPYARHMPAYKLGRWDGKIGFATVGGGTYINLLDRVLPLIIAEGYEIEIKDERPDTAFAFPEVDERFVADRVWPEGHPDEGEPILLRDYQVEAIGRYLANPQSIQSISTGAGKAQPLWSRIKIPGGWTTMGQIRVGDLVSTPDGGVAPVLGLYPQGKKRIYRLTFADGRTAEACEEHLWTTFKTDRKRHLSDEHHRWKNMTTGEIANYLAREKGRGIFISLAQPEQRKPADLPLDPYVLGVLLGDGSLRHHVMFSSADAHIIERVNARLDAEHEVSHASGYDYRIRMKPDRHRAVRALMGRNDFGLWARYRQIVIDLGIDTGSHEKFVPGMFLEHANTEQRLELIRGLLDTDGYVGRNGDISFCSTSHRLAEDMAYLVRSIGGLATIRDKTTSYTYKGEKKSGRTAYNVSIRHPNPKSLLTLPRKLDRISDNYQYKDCLRLRIVAADYIGDYDAQCIYIDHPDHLYITDNFVVTHNTLLTSCLSLLCEPYGRTLVIVPSKSLVEQTEEDYRNLGLDVGVYYGDRKEFGRTHTICTWQGLEALMKKQRDDLDIPISMGEFTDGVSCVMVDECFSPDTPILTPYGWKPIRDIQPGDHVINYSENDGIFKEDTVVRVFENMIVSNSEDMLELQMDNGSVIKATANHKFLTNRGWVRADHLSFDDEIVSWDQRDQQ